MSFDPSIVILIATVSALATASALFAINDWDDLPVADRALSVILILACVFALVAIIWNW